MHVFIQGIHIFTLVNPVIRDGMVAGRYQVVYKNRFAQKIGYLQRGQSVHVLAGGHRGMIDAEPIAGELTIRLLDATKSE